MKRIFLIGYMGTGKTTVGRELAQTLELDFIDLDHYIQARFQKTVSQLFAEEGEAKFREIERNMLKEVGDIENVVVSTGGGTPCFFDNMAYMNEQGKTVYLKATAQALSDRLNTCKEKRPLIKDKDEAELLAFVTENLITREPFYAQAHIIFHTEEFVNRDEINIYVDKLIKQL